MKQALMMVTALGIAGISEANASVANSKVQAEYKANSDVQIDATGEVSFSADEMSRKIAELEGKYSKPLATAKVRNTAKKSTGKSSDTLLGLINDLESKASVITSKNDALESYHSEMKARRLAEENAKLEKKAKAKKLLAKKLLAKKLLDKKLAKKAKAKKSVVAKKSLAKKVVAKKKSTVKKKATNKRRRLNNRARPVVAARRASRSAHSRSKGLCAKYVRKALQSAGYRFTPNPSAYQYATRGTLRKAGFVKISNRSKPQVGDVVVVSRSRAHKHGHISIYDGRNWVSDFRQKKANPYRKSYPYTTWRDARYVNASSSGLYMAGR